MTKTWSDYSQLTSLNSRSEFEQDVSQGLSDEEELKRWQDFHGHALTIQNEDDEEVLMEIPDRDTAIEELRELGLVDNE